MYLTSGDMIAIVIALDVTGSMGSIPHFLVKEGLPNIMKRIIDIDKFKLSLHMQGYTDKEIKDIENIFEKVAE